MMIRSKWFTRCEAAPLNGLVSKGQRQEGEPLRKHADEHVNRHDNLMPG